MLSDEVREFLSRETRERFLRYVQIHTTPDEKSSTQPSTARQFDLLRVLDRECRELGLVDVELTDTGFVYATLPARDGVAAPPFGLLAHVDTSPEQPGEGVRPRCHEAWDGTPIAFPDDPDLTLAIEDCAELGAFVGDTIITASGRTLLGADDKAGVAEIMTALAALNRFPELPHGEIRACFTTDEEIGRGTDGIDLDRLPKYCYTVDGSFPGELEAECFDAWRADLSFHGVGVHPGMAKDKLVNASVIGARFVADLPEDEAPEHTDGRDGFFYIVATRGSCERAEVSLIIRDFETERNQERIALLEDLRAVYLERYPGLGIDLEVKHQYQNMRDVLAKHPEVVDRAERAIADTGLEPRRKSVRGGTDGSLLSQLGHPTPNIFSGGLLYHSRREWIAGSALAHAAETLVQLARRWAEGD